MAMLNKLSTSTQWWIKGDGTDVVKGLWESVSGEWAGDVDLNDGKLQEAYKKHQDTIKWVKSIGLESQSIEHIKQQLMKAKDMISTEISFVSNGTICVMCCMFQ